jgi:hypothetical protein
MFHLWWDIRSYTCLFWEKYVLISQIECVTNGEGKSKTATLLVRFRLGYTMNPDNRRQVPDERIR